MTRRCCPDGTGISYRAAESKALTLTLSLDTPTIGRKFDVRDTEIGASQSITLTDDSADGTLVFSKANATGGTYDLGIGVIDDTGVQQFTHRGVNILSGDTHYLIYDTWDGAGDIELRIDHGSDGTVDQIIALDNQSHSVFLPLLIHGQ